MSDDSSKKKYVNLDQLDTSTLESILRTELLSPEEDNAEMIDSILEVMVEREQKNNPGNLPDTNKAREEFHRLYRNLEEPLYPTKAEKETATAPSPEPIPFTSRSKRRSLRRFLIVAAVIAALITATSIPVLGYANVIQMVAHWTAEQFSFQTASGSSEDQVRATQEILPPEYSELQAALEPSGIRVAIPEFPEGFEAEEPTMHTSPETGDVKFSIMYTKDPDYITLDIVQNSGQPVTKYEKDQEAVETYPCGGVTHYIFRNKESNVATWYTNELEYCLATSLPVSELEQMIQSIYEE